MKKITLFALILVLMVSILSFDVFADDEETSVETSTATLTTNETETQNNNDVNIIPNPVEAATAETNQVQPVVSDEIKKEEIKKEEPKKINKEQEDSKAKKLNAVKSFIKSKNKNLSDAVVTKVAEAALYANYKNQFDLSMILAVMWKESTFNPDTYYGNCYGLMQVHRNTGKGFGYKVSDLKDPYKSAYLGSLMLKGHIKNYNSVIMGLTAYNQGTGNVNKGNYNTRYANDVVKKQAIIQKYLDSALK